jgi:hypothetical protein
MASRPALLRENKSHFVFLRKGSSTAQLSAVVASAGLPDSRVSDVEAGYMQFVQWGSLSFVHLHLPSGSRELVAREAMFCRLRSCLCLPVPPCLWAFSTASSTSRTQRTPTFVAPTSALKFLRGWSPSFNMWTPSVSSILVPARSLGRDQASARYDQVYLPPSPSWSRSLGWPGILPPPLTTVLSYTISRWPVSPPFLKSTVIRVAPFIGSLTLLCWQPLAFSQLSQPLEGPVLTEQPLGLVASAAW